MRDIKIGTLKKTTVTLYETIEDLPICQYNLLQEYSIKDSEVGGGVDEILRKLTVLITLINNDLKAEAKQLVANFYQTIWATQNGVNFKSMQFGTIIHAVDGEPVNDYSETNLLKVIADLSSKGLTQRLVANEIELLKKVFRPSSN